jgi:beta-mannanase
MNGLPLSRPSTAQLNAIAQRSSLPEITWEPWDASKGLYVSQPTYRLSNIIDGRFDGYIWTWARALAKWKHPVLLRFAQEMDGNWFAWDEYANGNHVGQFVLAWRHVHRIFQLAGATNVKWVWSPAFANSAETFPGTGSVDVVATTCQNGDKRLFARGWQSFAEDCGPTIARLHKLAPGLPIQLSETASAEAGGSKAQWISEMFAYLAHHPEVKSVIWFNIVKETDWRIESSPAAQRAFAAGARAIGAV